MSYKCHKLCNMDEMCWKHLVSKKISLNYQHFYNAFELHEKPGVTDSCVRSACKRILLVVWSCSVKRITICFTKIALIEWWLGRLNLYSKALWYISIFSCDQAALQMVFSVCPSVCSSVCHTFFTMFPSSHPHEIFWTYYQWPNSWWIQTGVTVQKRSICVKFDAL